MDLKSEIRDLRKFCANCRAYVKTRISIQTSLTGNVSAKLYCTHGHVIEEYKDIKIEDLKRMLK